MYFAFLDCVHCPLLDYTYIHFFALCVCALLCIVCIAIVLAVACFALFEGVRFAFLALCLLPLRECMYATFWDGAIPLLQYWHCACYRYRGFVCIAFWDCVYFPFCIASFLYVWVVCIFAFYVLCVLPFLALCVLPFFGMCILPFFDLCVIPFWALCVYAFLFVCICLLFDCVYIRFLALSAFAFCIVCVPLA